VLTIPAVAAIAEAAGADLRLVYCTEAHPSDGWAPHYAPPGFEATRYARSAAERVGTAVGLAAAHGIDAALLLVDGIGDELERRYEARPERLFVVQRGKLLWAESVGTRSRAAFPDQAESLADLAAFLAASRQR